MREVGAEIRRLREGRGWTGAQLAVYSGMAPSAISQIETGRRSPNTSSLAKIARALEVEVVDLFPKVSAPLFTEPPSDPAGDEAQRRMLPYVRPWLLYLERYCERWEAKLGPGSLSKDAFYEFGANFGDVMAAIDSLWGILHHEGLDPMAGPIGLTFRETLLRLSALSKRVVDARLDAYTGDVLRAKKRFAEQGANLDALTKARAG